MSHKLFISHDSEDAELAGWLTELLEEIFADCTVFLSGRDLRGGSVWPGHLQEELNEAALVIALMTPKSLDNLWVHFEAGAAFPRQAAVPVCAGGLSKSQLRPPLSLLQARDLTQAGLEDLCGDIAAIVGLERNPGASAHVQDLIAGRLVELSVEQPRAEDLKLPVRIQFGKVDDGGMTDGFWLLFQEIVCSTEVEPGVTIESLRWETLPNEVILRPVNQHLEDGGVCFGFDTGTGSVVHQLRAVQDAWRFPADIRPGESLVAIVPCAARPILESRSKVKRDGFLLRLSVMGAGNHVLGTGETRVVIPYPEELS